MNYNQISNTLNIQLRGCDNLDSLTAGLRLAVYALADDFEDKDPYFDRLQFEHDCFKFTQFSDGGKKLQERETYMMS